VSVNELGDQYVLLGPYFEQKARQEVEEEDFPFHHPLGQVRGPTSASKTFDFKGNHLCSQSRVARFFSVQHT
jgi:hypothetical protein